MSPVDFISKYVLTVEKRGELFRWFIRDSSTEHGIFSASNNTTLRTVEEAYIDGHAAYKKHALEYAKRYVDELKYYSDRNEKLQSLLELANIEYSEVCPQCNEPKTTVLKRRQNTAYGDDDANFILCCQGCFEMAVEYWEERWEEYRGSRF